MVRNLFCGLSQIFFFFGLTDHSFSPSWKNKKKRKKKKKKKKKKSKNQKKEEIAKRWTTPTPTTRAQMAGTELSRTGAMLRSGASWRRG
jgi:hypothetical protein